MCRYAYHEYRNHFVCFACRKMFRQWMKFRQGQTVVCPQCHAPMADMGLDFKAPKQTDVRQWEKARLLYLNGYTWKSCGCGSGPRVKELRDVAPFLEAREWSKADEWRQLIAERSKEEKHRKQSEKYQRKCDLKFRRKLLGQ